MPTLKRFPNCRIEVRFGDHNPPHFHVVFNDGREVLMEIANMDIMLGHARRSELASVVGWAMENRTLLNAAWKECNP